LVVRRSGNTALAGTIDWSTTSDTAVAGVDYTAGSGVLSFAAGESTKTVDVALAGNPFAPGDRTFHVTLSGGSGATVQGAALTSLVTITNVHSVVSFATTTFAVGESAGTLTFSLTRVGNLGRAVSVGYTTAVGTAAAGPDYVAAAGTVSFAPGQSI